MKKILNLLVILIITISISGCNNESNDKLKVVSTVFVGYDAVRAIAGEAIDSQMLIKPGSDVHSYDPSPKDLVNIKTSDVFIYVGGESEEWALNLLPLIDTDKTKIVRMMDYVDLREEETVEGMESEEEEDGEEIEMDEHVWTSPINMKKISEKIKEALVEVDSESKDTYETNYREYASKLDELDKTFKEIVNTSNRKEVLFADRFPLLYFVKEYGLNYYAAFNGCAESTEASSKTISFLIDKVKEDNIPYIFTIELSNKKIAKTISEETGTQILEFNTLHNISKEDFENKETYISLMNKNVDNLRKALN